MFASGCRLDNTIVLVVFSPGVYAECRPHDSGSAPLKNPLAHRASSEQRFLMQVEVEKEEDGRWIAEVPTLRGAMAYGATKKEAVAKVEALVLRALADRIEHGEEAPELSQVFTVAA
jgi:predicted RNase H-like HicB family nuclease